MIQNKKIQLSIIIPVYKVEKYIKKCLDSIFNQNVLLDSYEVIVVNDSTPDASMLIVSDFERRFNNITVIAQENQGLSVARNSGLEKASGEYIWFIDSDDSIYPNCLVDIYNTIVKYNVDVIATKLNRVNELSGESEIEKFKEIHGVIKGKEYLFKGLESGAIQRFIIKRELLNKHRLFFIPGVFHEDADFGPKLLYLASSAVLLEKPIYNYLLRSNGSIMSSKGIKNFEDLIIVHHSLEEFKYESVEKDDYKSFNYKIYRILLCSIVYAKGLWSSPEYKMFYKKHKWLYRSKVLYLKGKKGFGINDLIIMILMFISPLFYYKYGKLLVKIKRSVIRFNSQLSFNR